MNVNELRGGQVLYVGADCGVPFNVAPLIFRLIRIVDHQDWSTTAWLDGYALNQAGDAIERRSLYVIVAGLRVLEPAPRPRNLRHAEAHNTAARLPKQRITSTPRPTRRTR